MNTTQEHLSIADIQNDLLLLKGGGAALVLQVSAVNFGLLSDREQMAIIFSFAQMLNSLSFTIQIVIISERLNISSYLTLLDKARQAQANPLLSQMIVDYKLFIQSTVKENDVLDKKFYLIVPLFAIELGLTASKVNLEQKIKTVLMPRRDQIIRQLNRVGLKASPMVRQQLIELFYNIYNGELIEKPAEKTVNPAELAVKLKSPQQTGVSENQIDQIKSESQKISTPENPVHRYTDAPVSSGPPIVTQNAKTHPFVVEELEG